MSRDLAASVLPAYHSYTHILLNWLAEFFPPFSIFFTPTVLILGPLEVTKKWEKGEEGAQVSFESFHSSHHSVSSLPIPFITLAPANNTYYYETFKCVCVCWIIKYNIFPKKVIRKEWFNYFQKWKFQYLIYRFYTMKPEMTTRISI